MNCIPSFAKRLKVHRSVLPKPLTSHVTHNDLSRTPPSDRYQIANAPTHHQPYRSAPVAQITIWIENCSGKQAVSVLKCNHLTTVKMPSQNQVVAMLTRRFPDARVVGAQNLI